jgi:hypothetical protein
MLRYYLLPINHYLLHLVGLSFTYLQNYNYCIVMIVVVVVVVVVNVVGDLREIVFYSHETQFRHRECATCAIPKYIVEYTVYRVYGVRRKQKMRHL